MSLSTKRPKRLIQGDKLLDELTLHIGAPCQWDPIRIESGGFPLWDGRWMWGRLTVATVATAEAILLAVSGSETLSRVFARRFAEKVLLHIPEGEFFVVGEEYVACWLYDEVMGELNAWRMRLSGL